MLDPTEELLPLDLEELAGELLGEDFDLLDLDFGLAFLSSIRPSCLRVLNLIITLRVIKSKSGLPSQR